MTSAAFQWSAVGVTAIACGVGELAERFDRIVGCVAERLKHERDCAVIEGGAVTLDRYLSVGSDGDGAGCAVSTQCRRQDECGVGVGNCADDPLRATYRKGFRKLWTVGVSKNDGDAVSEMRFIDFGLGEGIPLDDKRGASRFGKLADELLAETAVTKHDGIDSLWFEVGGIDGLRAFENAQDGLKPGVDLFRVQNEVGRASDGDETDERDEPDEVVVDLTEIAA